MEPIDLQTIQTETMNKQTCERCGGKHNKQQSCPELNVKSADEETILQECAIQEYEDQTFISYNIIHLQMT